MNTEPRIPGFPTEVGTEVIVSYPAETDWLGNETDPGLRARVRAIEVGYDRPRTGRHFLAEIVEIETGEHPGDAWSIFESEVERDLLTIEPVAS